MFGVVASTLTSGCYSSLVERRAVGRPTQAGQLVDGEDCNLKSCWLTVIESNVSKLPCRAALVVCSRWDGTDGL